MTDVTTPTTPVDFATYALHVATGSAPANAGIDRSVPHASRAAETGSQAVGSTPSSMRLLAAAEQREEALRAELAAVSAQLTEARDGQIRDGSDHRLEHFWDKVERVATAAGFCDEYDRIAEAMGGPRREREFQTQITISLDVTISDYVDARDEDSAIDHAEGSIDIDTIVDAIRSQVPDWTISERSASEG